MVFFLQILFTLKQVFSLGLVLCIILILSLLSLRNFLFRWYCLPCLFVTWYYLAVSDYLHTMPDVSRFLYLGQVLYEYSVAWFIIREVSELLPFVGLDFLPFFAFLSLVA